MKKIYSLLLSLVLLSAFTACKNEVDDVFDKSSSERIEDAINDYSNVLTSASKGWIMKYYADTKYGGYNLYCKFNADNSVGVSSELYPDSLVTSHYTVKQSEGVVLSFDTYNTILHRYSDPDASISGAGENGEGMLGDFEFSIISACPDSIVMKGKKHGSRIVMVPVANTVDWTSFCAKIKVMDSNIKSSGKFYLVSGTDSVKITRSYHRFSFTDPGSGNTIDMPYILTENGVELYESVVYDGKTITGFNYSGDGNWLGSSDSTIKLCSHFSLASFLVSDEYMWHFSRSGLTETKKWDAWIKGVYPSFISSFGSVSVLAFTCLNSSQVAFYCEFGGGYVAYLTYNLVENSSTEVTFEFTKTGDSLDNGVFLYENWYWNYITSIFAGKTFEISVDDQKKPSVMTLTEKDNPSNVITLSSTVDKNKDPFLN